MRPKHKLARAAAMASLIVVVVGLFWWQAGRPAPEADDAEAVNTARTSRGEPVESLKRAEPSSQEDEPVPQQQDVGVPDEDVLVDDMQGMLPDTQRALRSLAKTLLVEAGADKPGYDVYAEREDKRCYVFLLRVLESFSHSRMPEGRRIDGWLVIQCLLFGSSTTDGAGWVHLLDRVREFFGEPPVDRAEELALRLTRLTSGYHRELQQSAKSIDDALGLGSHLPSSDPGYDSASEWRKDEWSALNTHFLRDLRTELDSLDFELLMLLFEANHMPTL